MFRLVRVFHFQRTFTDKILVKILNDRFSLDSTNSTDFTGNLNAVISNLGPDNGNLGTMIY